LLLLLLLFVAAPQGFPDHHVFVGLDEIGRKDGSHGKGTKTVDARYTQVCWQVWYHRLYFLWMCGSCVVEYVPFACNP
jgi:hypothetical protein